MGKYRKLRFYGDNSSMLICEFTCQICNKYKPVLEADCSYGEYGPCYICLDCLTPAFQAFNGDMDRPEPPTSEGEK